MPRIFNVTFTKEFEVTIVAESEEELEAALKEAAHEIDDWTDDTEWETSIYDPYDHLKKAEQVPTKFAEPEMGVANGEAVNILDYKKVHPDYMDRLQEEATQLALRFNTEKLTPKLPGM